jgi:SHS2 domain-containing protein
MKHYDLIDHTADIGIKAHGKNISQAFENAAIGMFDIITDKSKIENQGEYTIKLDASDLEQLLVDWLSKLLYLNGAENLVFGKFQVKIVGTHLSAQVFGEQYTTKKHKQGTEIKAVTYHMLEVHQEKPCFVTILFDI